MPQLLPKFFGSIRSIDMAVMEGCVFYILWVARLIIPQGLKAPLLSQAMETFLVYVSESSPQEHSLLQQRARMVAAWLLCSSSLLPPEYNCLFLYLTASYSTAQWFHHLCLFLPAPRHKLSKGWRLWPAPCSSSSPFFNWWSQWIWRRP